MRTRDAIAEITASGRVTAEDVQALRRAIYSDGTAEKAEVERLFEVNDRASEQDPSWCALFTEAMSDYLVEQVEPPGYIDEANAEWLISRIAQHGQVKTATELELLVKVLQKATSSPERLSAFALRQVKKAVIDGDGPLARGGRLEPGRVSRDEVELLRRILYAFGGDGNVAITRAEAEVLFDINDATAMADNDPAWADLFVKAIASFTMATSGYAAPSREEVIRREAWLDEPAGGVADVFGRIAAGGLRGMLGASRAGDSECAWAERNARVEREAAAAESLTAGEAEWLASRIGRDGQLHPNEKALLRFIRDEAPSVHPSLQSLIAKAA